MKFPVREEAAEELLNKTMSSEVCPFCGKTYKRLKSHLPHCKAAASSKTPPTKRDVAANQTSPRYLAAGSSKTPPTKRDVAANQTSPRHLPAGSSKTPPTKRDVAANQTSPRYLAAGSSKATAKRQKSIQTETTGPQPEKDEEASSSSPMTSSSSPMTSSSSPMTSSSSPMTSSSSPMTSSSSLMTSSPINSTSLPPSTRKQKHKLSDQIKAATLSPLVPIISKPKKQSLRALIEAAKSDWTQRGEDLPSDSTLSSRTTTKAVKHTVKDDARLLMSADSKDAPKKKSKTKKASSTTAHTEDSLDSGLNKLHARDFWVNSEEEMEDLSVNNLKDVKSRLSRGSHQSIIMLTQSDQLRSTSQQTELKPVKFKALKSKHPASISPPQPDPASVSLLDISPPQPGPDPLLPARTSSPPSFSPTERLNVGHHVAGLSGSPALGQISSPLHFSRAQTLPVNVHGVEKLQLRKPNAAQHPEGVLVQRSLGQVSLKDLPEWMFCRTPGHPREVLDLVQRGWRWYYRKYIDVKKGGVAGLSMLLAGYCMMSYIWSYPHIKLDRWRKYH